jgi:hypothetical protein
MTAREWAIKAREALDGMDYFEGTLRRDNALENLFQEAIAEERGECAKVCLELHERHRWQGGLSMKVGAYECYETIQAREQP